MSSMELDAERGPMAALRGACEIAVRAMTVSVMLFEKAPSQTAGGNLESGPSGSPDTVVIACESAAAPHDIAEGR
jgi:hypothetical protein